MSRILLATRRDEVDVERIERITSSMAPDNITPRCMIMTDDVLAVGICNPDDCAPQSPHAVVVGHFFREEKDWDVVGDRRPDGSYALCRWSNDAIQVVTDATGSRGLWYAITDTDFVVSSSIGAIVELLKQFEFDERVVPWMIATGSLGEYSWDKHIKRCPADCVITFDRRAWTVEIDARPVKFAKGPVCLGEVLNRSFSNLRLPHGSVVTLSGGVDSRAILAAMPDPSAVASITWGATDKVHDAQSDVAVAKQVAHRLSSPNRFLPLEETEAGIEDVVTRFIDVSEGRVDHLAGYSDGFALWKMLYEAGVRRIIRGDEGFGWNIAINETQVRRDLGLTKVSDFFPEEQRESLGLAEVTWPESYVRQSSETLETWRDRLYHVFRIPVILASLNDIKGGYVEIANPLLARELIDAARQLSDAERTEKRAFRRWAKELGPPLPYAKVAGTSAIGDLLRTPDFVRLVESEVGSSPVLTEQFRCLVISKLKAASIQRRTAAGSKAWLRKVLPSWLKASVRARQEKVSIEPTVLALRAVIIARMYRKLYARASGSANASLDPA